MHYTEQDRGYAYVIAIASFLGHVLQFGVVWTVGVFYEVFIELFPENSGKVAFISSINTATFYLVGEMIVLFMYCVMYCVIYGCSV